jgi:hypothetical protein
MNNNQVSELLSIAITRMLDNLRKETPALAQQAEGWVKKLAGTDDPADYYRHPLAFPAMLLPWWVEQSLGTKLDKSFQADLIYSSVTGYYFIRLIDNVMDGHGPEDAALLPLLGFFHTQFHSTYQPYFEFNHPFWVYFNRIGILSADYAINSSLLNDIDLDTFMSMAGLKVCGGKIPIAAVCYHYHSEELLPRWEAFFDRLGCWHQMFNDLFGWIKDLKHNTSSYFLSEAKKRKHPDDSIVTWVVRTGFDWGLSVLNGWMEDLQQNAATLSSDELVEYLNYRNQLLSEQATEIKKGFATIELLLGNGQA